MNTVETKYNEMLIGQQELKETINKFISLCDGWDLINGAEPTESQELKDFLAEAEALIGKPVTTRVAYWEVPDED